MNPMDRRGLAPARKFEPEVKKTEDPRASFLKPVPKPVSKPVSETQKKNMVSTLAGNVLDFLHSGVAKAKESALAEIQKRGDEIVDLFHSANEKLGAINSAHDGALAAIEEAKNKALAEIAEAKKTSSEAAAPKT